VNNLIKRLLWGGVYVIVLMAGILIHPVLFALVFGALLFFAQYEFYELAGKAGYNILRLPGTLLGVLFFLICFGMALGILSGTFSFIFMLIILSLFIIELFRSNQGILQNAGITVLCFVYIVLPFCLLNFIVLSSGRAENVFYPWILAGIFFILWANDSFAYLTGSLLGKHKMCPGISPAKSWEGLIGGAVFALIMGILNAVFFQKIGMLEWMVIALLTTVFGTLGDLFQSKVKREIGIKDSGSVLPGHGGFLDRLDSLLFVIPAVFVWLMFCGNL